MTNLTRFECSFSGIQPHQWWSRPCRFPVSKQVKNSSLCWVLYVNKGLEHINVVGIEMTETKPVRHLVWILSGLAHLKSLELTSQDQTNDHVGEFLFFHSSQTLVKHDPPGCGVALIPRIPMPLLKNVRMPDKPMLGYTDELCPVLENCPALESWHLPTVGRRPFGIGEIRAIIKDLQLPLKKTHSRLPETARRAVQDSQQYKIPGSIIAILAPYTLKSFSISSFEEDLKSPLTSKLFRHLATLCVITFDAVEVLFSSTIRDILTRCHALEKLVVRRGSNHNDPNDIALLEDISLTTYDAIAKTLGLDAANASAATNGIYFV
ncbi:hypothetical protein BGW39_002294 [Mortierella sp. 14UC]|nr:hypothetical protein BGW39_002294 [Mortierella sp. 14UC]